MQETATRRKKKQRRAEEALSSVSSDQGKLVIATNGILGFWCVKRARIEGENSTQTSKSIAPSSSAIHHHGRTELLTMAGESSGERQAISCCAGVSMDSSCKQKQGVVRRADR